MPWNSLFFKHSTALAGTILGIFFLLYCPGQVTGLQQTKIEIMLDGENVSQFSRGVLYTESMKFVDVLEPMKGDIYIEVDPGLYYAIVICERENLVAKTFIPEPIKVTAGSTIRIDVQAVPIIFEDILGMFAHDQKPEEISLEASLPRATEVDTENSVTFYVQYNAPSGGDGSKDAPFSRVDAALAAAEDASACCLVIKVANGMNLGDLTITRPTVIEGESQTQTILRGSVINPSGWNFELRNLQIRSADNIGFLQSGGTLKLENVIVWATRLADSDCYSSGRGIILNGGVQANLKSVTITRNQGQGLLAEGQGTLLRADGLKLENNKVNPNLAASLSVGGYSFDVGALEVRNDAKALIENFHIYNNEFVSIFVHHGAQAHLRDGKIERTTSVNSMAGNNVVALNNAVVELQSLSSSQAALVGLQVIESYMATKNVQVFGNIIGVNITGELLQPIACITDGAAFFDNDLNLDSAEISIPEPIGALDCMDEKSPSDECKKVLWK